jgi:flagellar hook-associated protein 3 FlgL
MRVTDLQMYNLATKRILDARSESVAAGDQVSSSTRVTHPWDDPAAAGQIATQAADQARQQAVYAGATAASQELVAADGAMGQVTNALTQAQELAVQLSSDSYNATDRANAVTQVQQLQQEVTAQLNYRYGDRYVFGGTADGAPPFNATTGAYVGNPDVRQVEIAPGVVQDASIRADQAFKGSAGGVDVLTALSDLSTALSTNNATQIRASVQTLADGIQQVTSFRSKAGELMGVFDIAAGTAKTFSTAAQTAQSNIQDADIFSATTRLAAAQTSLQASMSAATQEFKFSLLDKL